MNTSFLWLAGLMGPAALLAAALVAMFDRGRRPRHTLLATRLAMGGAVIAFGLMAVRVAVAGPLSGPTLGAGGLGLTVRLDALSVSLLGVVTLVGWVVLRFSRRYLDGDARHGAFLGGLALTLAAVMTLAVAGNLLHLVVAWIATSLALHRLLVFFGHRPRARLAARKKAIAARLGDLSLLGAAWLLYARFGTGDLGVILEAAPGVAFGPDLEAAAILLALAALLKSASFPTHGWLVEVMETPTPVSALLHAGIVNAGGFLILRLADVVLRAPSAGLLLVAVGGFTALFGSVVALTQSRVKTALAYSTVGQMGFMLFECGIGAYRLALLHLVAHSLYKAHAFLTSASAVEGTGPRRHADPVEGASAARRGAAASLALGLAVCVTALALGVGGGYPEVLETPAWLCLAAVVTLALTQWLGQALVRRTGVARALAGSALLALLFVGVERALGLLYADLPAPPTSVSPAMAVAMTLVTLGFAAVTLLQIVQPGRDGGPRWRALHVHLRNGLYTNALLDRLLGDLGTRPNLGESR